MFDESRFHMKLIYLVERYEIKIEDNLVFRVQFGIASGLGFPA
jgi:hypothetical protein